MTYDPTFGMMSLALNFMAATALISVLQDRPTARLISRAPQVAAPGHAEANFAIQDRDGLNNFRVTPRSNSSIVSILCRDPATKTTFWQPLGATLTDAMSKITIERLYGRIMIDDNSIDLAMALANAN